MNTYAHQEYVDTATHDAQEAAKELTALIGHDPGTIQTNPLVVMYFDDSHDLFEKKTADNDTYYGALLYALASLVMDGHNNLFSLFLSTNSRLTRYDPIIGMRTPGSRVQSEGYQAPFTELSFDCHPSFPIKESEWTMKQVVGLDFMCRFGRPLYVLLYF